MDSRETKRKRRVEKPVEVLGLKLVNPNRIMRKGQWGVIPIASYADVPVDFVGYSDGCIGHGMMLVLFNDGKASLETRRAIFHQQAQDAIAIIAHEAEREDGVYPREAYKELVKIMRHLWVIDGRLLHLQRLEKGTP